MKKLFFTTMMILTSIFSYSRNIPEAVLKKYGNYIVAMPTTGYTTDRYLVKDYELNAWNIKDINSVDELPMRGITFKLVVEDNLLDTVGCIYYIDWGVRYNQFEVTNELYRMPHSNIHKANPTEGKKIIKNGIMYIDCGDKKFTIDGKLL